MIVPDESSFRHAFRAGHYGGSNAERFHDLGYLVSDFGLMPSVPTMSESGEFRVSDTWVSDTRLKTANSSEINISRTAAGLDKDEYLWYLLLLVPYNPLVG
jgi:hypothetical protein